MITSVETIGAIPPQADGDGNQSTPPPATDSASALATKDAFLRLLVAQIKNQNPLNPADGVQFLTQLAQFTELEQMISIREDLEGLRQELAEERVQQG